MDINAEVSTQLSLIDVLLSDLDKTIAPCTNVKNEKKEEETQNAMPDSTTNHDKSNSNTFNCGDDVLVANKDGRYYLGTIVELSSSDIYSNDAQFLVKFGDGTHAWAPISSLKQLSAPPVDDGRIMCVVCKERDGPASSPATNAIIPCDMCGRGYHAKCHTPPVDAWINGASWHCKRCVEQRFRVAAAENRALRRTDPFRLKGAQRRGHHDLIPPCDTASTTSSTASELGKTQSEEHCYCGEKSDWLAQMLMCCRCSRWFHQRCVSSLQYPLYAGDKLYIFACSSCNGGREYLRRLELCWLDLAHLALYNLTAYNAPNYFDLDDVIMPYILDNWHALQLPEKMWRTAVKERRERILTALTSSRKRFKCGREMKKRATIWGLRLRRPPPPPHHLAALQQIKKGEPLTDKLVRENAPRLKFLSRAPSPQANTTLDDSSQPSSSNSEKSSYNRNHSQHMIVPVDGHWLNLMMGKRFHENLNNSNSENDSTSSYESAKPSEPDETPTAVQSITKDDNAMRLAEVAGSETSATRETSPVPSNPAIASPVMENADKLPKENDRTNSDSNITIKTHTTRIATMNMEVSKLSTKNIIEHSKIMSLQHMDTTTSYPTFLHEVESSGDETSSRGTLDAIIPPLKDFQGKNNPFLMQNSYSSKKLSTTKNGKINNSRFSLPLQFNQIGAIKPLKRKLSEKDIVIGPNGEVKRRKYRRPRKHLQAQQQANLNKSCPLPEESTRAVLPASENCEVQPAPKVNNPNIHGRRLRQRQEKNYYENARRSTNNNSASSINSVKSLQLSPHKVNGNAVEVDQRQLSALKSSVQSYFRAGQTFSVLARRNCPNQLPAYLIQWDSNANCGTT